MSLEGQTKDKSGPRGATSFAFVNVGISLLQITPDETVNNESFSNLQPLTPNLSAWFSNNGEKDTS